MRKQKKYITGEEQGHLFSNLSLLNLTSSSHPILNSPPVDQSIVSYADCVYNSTCDSRPDQPAIWGCFTSCVTTCEKNFCDYTCPSRTQEFARRVQEVGGLERTDCGTLTTPIADNIPGYVPVIYNASSRSEQLKTPIVAIPIRRALALRNNGRYGPSSTEEKEFKVSFGLAPETHIIITGVAHDRYIEKFWRYGSRDHVAQQLAELNLIGMTVPNFSFFSDAPRPHILYNRRRIISIAEQLSEAGVPVILHLNALTKGDWKFWAKLLCAQSHIIHVAKEFQTGLSSEHSAHAALDALAQLQEDVGRQLHPILLGAARFIPIIAKQFRSFTIIDSRPFLNTVKRRIIVPSNDGKMIWLEHPTLPGSNLDQLLQHNISTYSTWIEARIHKALIESC